MGNAVGVDKQEHGHILAKRLQCWQWARKTTREAIVLGGAYFVWVLAAGTVFSKIRMCVWPFLGACVSQPCYKRYVYVFSAKHLKRASYDQTPCCTA
ncbi:hypothetical protein CMUST_06830 [Corynebacterium mustelae]|uniref:Uncharacterized protein n=1 Tax=Corynebacterium mustelae TaxID=571915 RepID=A0A0G3GYW3_9CORY|nr:hypothetical protein CMUST_06830 [Corynebacterium mustelae]